MNGAPPVWKSKFYGAFVLHRSVDLHAIDAMPARWRAPDTLVDFHTGVDYALSREEKNKKGGKMYIQDKVEEYADEIFERLQNGAVMYFCGLKGMMPGIQDMLKEVCRKKGLTYDDFVADLKKKGQWRVEVY